MSSSSDTANVTAGANASSAISGAFGMGMDYFSMNEEQRQEVLASNASTLEPDEWQELSDAMVESYQANLVGIADLVNANLVRSVDFATKISRYTKLSEYTEAEVSMSGETDSEEDRPGYTAEGTPIPIIHKGFRVDSRDLESSRKLNNDLQADGVTSSTRAVSEMNEKLLFNGWSPSIRDSHGNTFQVYGYTTHPQRNMVAGSDWGTADNIRDDIVSGINILDDANRTAGGFWLYLAPPQFREFRSAIDPDGDGNLTVRERVLSTFDQEIRAVRRAEHLDDGEGVMVDPRRDVVQLVRAEDIQVIEWTSGSEMTHHYRVFSAMAPEVKSDAQGRSGVAHITGI